MSTRPSYTVAQETRPEKDRANGREKSPERIRSRERDGRNPTEQDKFPPGGFTPVFNEVEILLAISPDRPPANADCADLDGPCEEVLMQNIHVAGSGVVKPTVFNRSDTFVDPNTGLRTQLLMLMDDSGLTNSMIFGGELTMFVRPNTDNVPAEGFPKDALPTFDRPSRIVLPLKHSLGRIQALSTERDFPARVVVPVHYTFMSGGRDGKLSSMQDNFASVAKEEHVMEGVVMSVPPSPNECISATGWDLVDESAFLKLWIRVKCFRFLGLGDYEHKDPVERTQSQRRGDRTRGAEPETYSEELAGEFRIEISADLSLIFGADHRTGEKETVPMRGYAIIREWPSPEYRKRKLADGREQFDFQFVKADMKGFSKRLGEHVHVMDDPKAGNFGTITQQTAGVNFPAVFQMERNVLIDVSLGRLKNAKPLRIYGLMSRIPPVISKQDPANKELNVFHVINDEPTALVTEDGLTRAYFEDCVVFASSAKLIQH